MSQWKPEDGKSDPLGRHNHILKPYPVSDLPQILFDLPTVKNFLLPDHD
jgi:hypothetical protein